MASIGDQQLAASLVGWQHRLASSEDIKTANRAAPCLLSIAIGMETQEDQQCHSLESYKARKNRYTAMETK